MASERKFVAENVRRVLLKEYLMKEVSRAGFGGLDVQRTPMGTRVILSTERPGLVIGRKGQTIKNLTGAIEDQFGFENPQIEVQEVENPNLNAQILRTDECPALRKCQPLSSENASFSAMIWALRLGFSTSWTSIWGFSKPNCSSIATVRFLMV